MASVSALGGCTTEHRSSILEMFCKKGVLKTFAKFTVKQLARVSFLTKLPALACNFTEKETLAQRFCYEFWDIFKKTFLYRTSPMVVSENSNGKHQCKNAVKENN